jgi:hypothetical protein
LSYNFHPSIFFKKPVIFIGFFVGKIVMASLLYDLKTDDSTNYFTGPRWRGFIIRAGTNHPTSGADLPSVRSLHYCASPRQQQRHRNGPKILIPEQKFRPGSSLFANIANLNRNAWLIDFIH